MLELIERNDGLLDACFGETSDEETLEVYLEFKRYSDGIKALRRSTGESSSFHQSYDSKSVAMTKQLRWNPQVCCRRVPSGRRVDSGCWKLMFELINVQIEMVRSQFGQVIMND